MATSITVAICGCGNRGLEAYAPFAKKYPDKVRIVAGADNRPERLALLQERYGVPAEKCFRSWEELTAQPRLADVMIIATQDRDHIAPAMAALEKGYHLLLEKPISPSLEECVALREKAHACNRAVVVCHVLRYTKFYSALEEILRRGDVGRIETINAMEHVAYWHFAHSFVRGNWRRSDESSPMILQKCCHDMDVLRWLAGASCVKVQSFGSLDYFRAENAPAGSAERCLDCACKDACPYDAEKIYITNRSSGIRSVGPVWPCNVLVSEPTEESLYEHLRTGPYGRCVFRSDNSVADRQTVNLEFANGVIASFTVSAFTERCYRSVRVTGTMGDIEGDTDTNTLRIHRFGQPEEVIDINELMKERSGHGGGDFGVMHCLYDLIRSGETEGLTGIDASVESHVMALAAELSRNNGGKTLLLSDVEQGKI